MANVSEVVQTTTTIKDAAANQANFGEIMYVGAAPFLGTDVGAKKYNANAGGLSAMVDDGFSTADPAYVELQTIAGQENAAEAMWVFGRTSVNVQEFKLTPTNTTEGIPQKFSLVGVDGVQHDLSYTNVAGETVENICDELTTLVAALTSSGVQVTDNTTDITLSQKRRVLTFDASGYTNAIASDVGKPVVGTTTSDSGTLVSYDNTARKWVVEIDDALDAFDDAETVSVTGGTGTGTTSGASVPGARFYLRGTSNHITVNDESADAGIATDLANAQAAYSGWYGLLIDSTSAAEIAAAATWAESNDKLFAPTSLDSDCVTSATDDIASTLQDSSLARTGVWFGRDGYSRLGTAIMGEQLALDPGSSVWALQQIALTQVDDLTATEITNLKAKNANYYVPIKGLNLTQGGVAAGGRYLDITRNIDYIEDGLATQVLTLLANENVVPYTNSGIAQIDNTILGWLGTVNADGVITTDYSTTPPKAGDALATDKANRDLKNFKWSATLQGGILTVEIDGTLSV
jgi:hypothetical protein